MKKIKKTTPVQKKSRQQKNSYKTTKEKTTAVKNNKKVKKKQRTKLQFRWYYLAFLAVIMVATYVAYIPAQDNQLLNWDDDVYVLDNLAIQKLDKQTLKVFFSTSNYFVSNYHPLTMITFAIDFSKGQLDPKVYHVTNIIIHVINTGLVFWLIYLLISMLGNYATDKLRKKNWAFEIAAICAALFGLHTLHVESVAWIAERKDVLYTMFFLLSLIAYIKYANRQNILLYILSLLLFTCSLLSKGMAVSLSVTLIAVDFLYNRKILSIRVIVEKIPFLVLSLIFGIIAVKAQSSSGALADVAAYQLHQRVAFASYGFIQYLLKLVYPYGLSGYYAYPDKIIILYWLCPLVVVPLFFAIRYAYQRSKLAVFGIAFFIINIALVLQVIPVGNAIMADRYSYVPSIGFFLLAGMGYKKLSEIKPQLLRVLQVIAVLYIGMLGYLTFERTKVWETSLTMWNDVIEQYENIPAAWNNRGNARKDAGMFEEAISDYNNALKLKPDHYKAFNNRGIAKKNLGDLDGAIADYNMSIKLKPDYDDAYSNRGNAKRLKHDYDGAIADYDKAISMKPNFAKALSNRGATKIDKGDLDGAIEDLNEAIRIMPYFVEAYYNVANAYYKKGDFDNSIRSYDKALQLRPTYAEAYSNRAGAKFQLKQYPEAIADYTKAIELKPDFLDAYTNRGGTRYNLENYDGAIADFTKAIELNPKFGRPYFLRGMSLVKTDRKDEACADLYKAAQLKFPGAYQQFMLNCKKVK